MMSKQRSSPGSSKQYGAIASGFAVTVVVIAAFFWPHTPVELNDHGYDLTTALYRVCNQQSVDGLAKVEQLMAENDADSPLNSASRGTLDSIIAQAKLGRWKQASIDCRQALDDQVQR